MDSRLDLPIISSIIGGAERTTSNLVPVRNPATGRATARLSLASATIADEAVEVARTAFPGWRDTAPAVRARVLMRFREIVERDKVLLAQVITEEHGKALPDALGSIQRGLEVVEFAMGAPHLLKGENSDHVATGVSTRSSRRPLGVCVGITPFNYPAMIPMWMFPVALACGNTFVLKPSERTPRAANMMAAMLAEAGLPPGVFNVVHGNANIATALIRNTEVAAVSFVGSSRVAQSVYEQAASCGKRVQALGGAKNHAIVMPDADMASTVSALLNGAFNSAGQRCMAISVLVTVGEARERLMPALIEAARGLKVAPGDDPDCYVPPVSFADHYERVKNMIRQGEAEGAHLVLDGRVPAPEEGKEGFFIGPVIMDKVDATMTVYQEEIFGPVLVVLHVDTLDKAIALSNGHRLGNGAVLFTASGASAAKFEREILCGMPGINVPVPSPVGYFSFGGNKGSLFGDLAANGPDSINFYTRRQVLTTRWP